MLYFNRIEAIDVNKTSESKERGIANIDFKFQPNVCNRCHDLLMMSMNLSDIAILNIKSEAMNLMQTVDLIKKVEHYQI